MARPKPVVLVILDGWGFRTALTAVTQANVTNFRTLYGEIPKHMPGSGRRSGRAHAQQMGDSNVGHLNIGAGRIVYQDLVRISNDIQTGFFP